MGFLDFLKGKSREQKDPAEVKSTAGTCAECKHKVASFRCPVCGEEWCADCAKSRSQGVFEGISDVKFEGVPEALRPKVEAGIRVVAEQLKAVVTKGKLICIQCSFRRAKPVTLEPL